MFKRQDFKGFEVWQRDFTHLRFPNLYNLRADPFERGDESVFYQKWMADRMFVQVPIQALVAKWIESFTDFPPRQKPATFNLDRVMESMMAPKAA